MRKEKECGKTKNNESPPKRQPNRIFTFILMILVALARAEFWQITGI
ncbi:MAG: hypothetical protein AABX32_00200 [Nanoarchaeota archaeon]